MPTAVVAMGGNSLIADAQHPTVGVTHGNGRPSAHSANRRA